MKQEGRLWSFLRTVLEHGAAIQQDYAAGKYASYEHYAARLDEAARDRAELFEKAFLSRGTTTTTERADP